jgi:predicted dehydrogenase
VTYNEDDVVNVGIVGCGNVLDLFYGPALLRHPALRVVATADEDSERAARAAAQFTGAKSMDASALIQSPAVEVVLNLTNPAGHAAVTTSALHAGKRVYSEKPLATTLGDAAAILQLSEQNRLRVGCAPDTVLGTGIQTARAFIDEGGIGTVASANATLALPGHELWHPNPDFYYKPGGGPVLDMGPYYFSALYHLLGPVVSVQAQASRPTEVRTIRSGARAGEQIPVLVDTHISALLQHESGAVSTVILSFDVVNSSMPFIEVHGSTGSISVPDPDRFDGPVSVSRERGGAWEELPVLAGYVGAERGVGLADMVESERDGVPHRANAQVAYHVLEVMTAIFDAGATGTRAHIQSRPQRPAVVALAEQK